MLYTITIKTEDGPEWARLRELITSEMDGGHPYYYNIKQSDTFRKLKDTKTPPNRNISDEQLKIYYP